MTEREPDDEGLLTDIAWAVASMDARLAGVETALVGPDGRHRGRRRGRGEPSVDVSPLLRRRRRRPGRGDAAGITWLVWAFDELAVAEQVDALRQIRAFVDWLNEAYQLPLSTWAVPSCWYRHPGAVRELWALVGSYRSAYSTDVSRGGMTPTDAPITWHDRMLWPCLRRLREELGLRECTASIHNTQLQSQATISTDDGFGGAVARLARLAATDGAHEHQHGPGGAEPAD